MHRRGFVVVLSEIFKDIDEVKASVGSREWALNTVWISAIL